MVSSEVHKSRRLHRIVLPDLGLGSAALRASVWLAPEGAAVVEGDRILEVVSGEVSIDLPAPASGRLAEQLVNEDDPLRVGQMLGVIEEEL